MIYMIKSKKQPETKTAEHSCACGSGMNKENCCGGTGTCCGGH
ncbi:MAG: hypothetical protein AABW64_03170 [Nanoarchaeota archaeon]